MTHEQQQLSEMSSKQRASAMRSRAALIHIALRECDSYILIHVRLLNVDLPSVLVIGRLLGDFSLGAAHRDGGNCRRGEGRTNGAGESQQAHRHGARGTGNCCGRQAVRGTRMQKARRGAAEKRKRSDERTVVSNGTVRRRAGHTTHSSEYHACACPLHPSLPLPLSLLLPFCSAVLCSISFAVFFGAFPLRRVCTSGLCALLCPAVPAPLQQVAHAPCRRVDG